MARYCVKRILSAIPLLLVVSFLVFYVYPYAAGRSGASSAWHAGNPGSGGFASGGDGAERPASGSICGLYERDFHRGSGESTRNGASVIDTIAPRFGPTIMLTLCSIVWAVLIGTVIGIVSAVNRGKLTDYFGMVVAICGISAPSFWLGLMLMQLFSVQLGLLPTSGLGSWQSYILPSLTMGAGVMAIHSEIARTSMLENLQEDYVRTARAKGLGEYFVIMRHAFRNSLIQVVTVTGLQIGGLLSGSVMVETVFSINGLGRLLVDSINSRDYKVVQALLLFFAVEYIVVNLIVDLLYGVLDPKIRYS